MSRAGSVRRDDFQPGITWARFAEMNFQPGFSTNDHSANDFDHLFPVIWWLFFALMQLDGLLYLYILFRRRNIDFLSDIVLGWEI